LRCRHMAHFARWHCRAGQGNGSPTPLEQDLPNTDAVELLDQGPAQPPPVIPHRGPTPKLGSWMRRFAVRRHLSYVRLGMEILRTGDLANLVRRAIRWLAMYLWA
ncbi:MAG: hypothetical protein KAW49_05365, partial [Anaerolineae bacterium]|nr:hypothetical protein [Anaerolineae bacterium]